MATPTSPNEHIHRARRRKVSPSYGGGDRGSGEEDFRLGIKQAGPAAGVAAKAGRTTFDSNNRRFQMRETVHACMAAAVRVQ